MATTTTWLIANWKMNGDTARVRAFAFAMNNALNSAATSIHGVFCPPVIYLAAAKLALPYNARLRLGAQNCHAEAKGAHTGELSATMLAENACSHVIVGHSERRATGETDEQVAAKAAAAIAGGLMPVICVGESREQYEAKKTAQTLSQQLAHLDKLPKSAYLIAYEPIWAIGSKQTPQMAEIAAAHRHIKTVLGSEVGVLYGGSVQSANLPEILALSEVSGALIGGASLEIESMGAMIATAQRIRGK